MDGKVKWNMMASVHHAEIMIGAMMMNKNNEKITLDCELINESHKAYKIEVLVGKKRKQCWVGKSVAEVIGDRKGTKVTLPQWLAEKEELV